MIEIELPRFLFAFFCGYFLTLSGSLTQTVANNSLASPSTLGFDGLAALCVIIGQSILLFGMPGAPLEYLSFGVFLVLCGPILAYLSTEKGATPGFFSLDIKFLVLVGLAFNLFVGAVFSVIQFLFMALNYEFPSGLWFGNFRYYHSVALYLFGFFFLVSLLFVKNYASSLRLISLGEGVALGFGVNVKKTQKACLSLSLVLTGLVISFFGVFSFLSLIIPHMLRGLGPFRRSMKNEVVYGPFLGGLVLAFLDWLCFRFDYMGAELPVGMVSSVVGAILLIVLLWRSQLKNFAKD